MCFALARKYKKANIYGVELNNNSVAESCRILKELNFNNLLIKQGDIIFNDLDGPYDLIICVDVLEHIIDDVMALRNLYNVLKREGTLLLHIPQRHQLNRTIFSKNNISERCSDHVRDEYDEEEIINKIITQGFVIKRQKYTFRFCGCLARELLDKIERLIFVGSAVKMLLFPLILFIAWFDCFRPNINWHQGFLFELGKKS